MSMVSIFWADGEIQDLTPGEGEVAGVELADLMLIWTALGIVEPMNGPGMFRAKVTKAQAQERLRALQAEVDRAILGG
ncbi:hypothetical protein [Knoellia sp. p5-6-4]|uniref:hypothetical protein n=1 Tax=unclassified Knoellia TaxID=2618719 RepID=UPI0023DC4F25|nr:hypothetical protein [Knoellia sp. p5-6-4]MDF2146357.1 hypothetical protein [Knoellia sp. p5-6-4]